MLNDATGFEKVYLATGRTDLRRGIDGLAAIIKYNFKLDPFQKNVLFLFCGRQLTKIKGLVWEGDGFLLLYKRLNAGAFLLLKKLADTVSFFKLTGEISIVIMTKSQHAQIRFLSAFLL